MTRARARRIELIAGGLLVSMIIAGRSFAQESPVEKTLERVLTLPDDRHLTAGAYPEVRNRDGRVVRVLGSKGRARDVAVAPAAAAANDQRLDAHDLPVIDAEGPTIVMAGEREANGADDAVASDTWPMFQANSRHTGYLPVAVDPQSYTLKWQIDVGGEYALNPVTAVGGRVFVTLLTYFADITSLFALSATDGELLWSKGFGDIFSVNPPSSAFGRVFVQTGNHAGDTWLRAYDAATGDLIFQSPHEAQWERYYAPTVHRGQVYINGGYYGGMYAFDARTGSMLWFESLPQYDQWTPAVDDRYAYAFVGDYEPGLYGRNRPTVLSPLFVPDPDFEWDGWSMRMAPAIGTHDDVIAIHDGRLISFDTVQGSIRWQVASQFTGQPSLAFDQIYAVDNGHLVVFDELTHAELWSWQPRAGALAGPMIVTDTHVFASTAQTVYAVDLATHQSVWSYPVAGHLALSEGTLYVAAADGTLTAFSSPLAPPAPHGSVLP